ncbi:MAG: HAMP domain-containing sensor histidine kinase [Deltaproteobacteria bacterium]|nr:HAMP domain-containing sensor histidine kinase [Deltaproteobacteria bacterium]
MITLPLWPIWFSGIIGSFLVVVFSFMAYAVSRRLMRDDPENALWLFLNWMCLAFVFFSLSHFISHSIQDLIRFQHLDGRLNIMRRIFGGFDSIIYVAIATITLFFHRIQRLYRRMEADHHQLEATSHEILALNREMEALVMERTMSEMALGMAHGIRNPLHVIGGFSHRLLKKTDTDDPTRAWLMAIAEEAKRIENMVERFETLAQRKSSFFAQVDLNEIIRETLVLIRPEVDSKHLKLVTEIHPEPIIGRLNSHLLKVALAHLLRNAIEATPSRGTITVRTFIEKSFAVLIIKDTGRGMPKDVVDKVFVPFYTTKIGGTGLGMVFVRQIVDEHRGTITLDSQVGRGTTVTIRLSLRFAEAPGVSGGEGEAPAPAPAGPAA